MDSEPRFDQLECRSPSGTHRLAWASFGARENPRVVICAHGLTRTGRDFDALARALAPDFRVVCPDMPGRGRSGWLPAGEYKVAQYVSDCQALLAHLAAGGATWFGWVGTSMGGLIGMALAALDPRESPHPIARLVLNDIGPILEPEAIAGIGSYVGRAPRFASRDEALAYLRQIHRAFGPHSDAEWAALNQASIVEEQGGFRLHYDPAIGDAFSSPGGTGAIDRTAAWEAWEKIRCPVLAIRGAESELLSAATHQEMSRRGPRARLVSFAGVGHAPTLIAPGQIAPVRDFLLEAPRAS